MWDEHESPTVIALTAERIGKLAEGALHDACVFHSWISADGQTSDGLQGKLVDWWYQNGKDFVRNRFSKMEQNEDPDVFFEDDVLETEEVEGEEEVASKSWQDRWGFDWDLWGMFGKDWERCKNNDI